MTSGAPMAGAERRIQEPAAGQALTEFLVLAFAMVPLFLLLPLIAKYQDIAHVTQMASRYLAFEATTRNDAVGTWKPVDQLSEEVRRRFFSNTDAPIKTNDTAGNFMAHQNMFWRDPKGAALIADSARDVTLGFGAGDGAGHGAGFDAASDGVPFTLRERFGPLQARGIYTARVMVRVADLPAGMKVYQPFDQLSLTIARSSGLLIDPWMARDPAQTQARLGADLTIFSANGLSRFDPLLSAVVGIIELPGALPAPKLGQLDFWRDVVPADRLRSR